MPQPSDAGCGIDWAMTTRVAPQMLHIKEAAALLRCSPETVRRRVRAGQIPATRLGPAGSAIRIPADALNAWLWAGPVTEREEP